MKYGRKATREQTKWHNSRLILTTIYDQGEISRADIARMTELTAATVSTVTAELLEDGLIEIGGSIPTPRGKPPTLLRVADDAYHLLCLNLAAGTFRGALVDLQGKIIHSDEASVNERTGDAALLLVYELIDRLLVKAASPIMGIGVGAPGVTDPNHGRVIRAVNYGWADLPLKALLQERYDLPVHLANASHAAVLAEYRFGHFTDVSDLVVVNIGRDVGAGIVLNGQLLLGSAFGAGEIGHVTVVEDGKLCRCGNRGCLETVISSRAIVEKARLIASEHPDSALNQLTKKVEEIELESVVKAFEMGDEYVGALVRQVSIHLGSALANVVGVLSVPRILLTGRITHFGTSLLTQVNREVKRRSLARLVSETTVDVATLGEDIVILGAAALLLQQELGVN